MRISSLALAAGLLGSVAMAQDALIVGNATYRDAQSRSDSSRVVSAAGDLADLGLAVETVRDGGAADLVRSFERFVSGLDPASGPVLIVLSGGFVHGTQGSYLLPVRQRGQGRSVAGVLTRAFPVDAALSVLSQHSGRAFLVLGEVPVGADLGPVLRDGLGPLDIPQGVTVIRGPAADVAGFVTRDLTRPGSRIEAGARRFGLEVEGYRPADLVMLRRDAVRAGRGDGNGTPARVVAAWEAAQRRDSAEAYERFVSDYPLSRYAAEARQRLAAIRSDPFFDARRAETRLELSRNARREIQRDLSLLGYDTRGIDGIFGPGTRGAIRSWQEQGGRESSGYLDAAQIDNLDAEARERAAELEAEARERRARIDERDRALWAEADLGGRAPDYRDYLQQFPDGIFADEARRALAELTRDAEDRAAGADRQAWRRAREIDTAAAYRRYLQDQPAGAFVGEARTRIAALEQSRGQSRVVERARAQEEALGLNVFARRLAEARLRQLDLDVGEVDGRFDAQSRAAIRRYQQARGLSSTGYLDQATVVRLLADGVLEGR